MNAIEKGRQIAKLRKEAGYTQKSLAKALFVTDKAVSKWERGLCLPDISLLTKISMLLDADIEDLILGKDAYREHKWVGMLQADNLEGMVAGKPLIHYLLSYFMLVGITDIAILTEDKGYIRELDLTQYGLNISYTPFRSEKTMIVYDKFLLFGVNITRQLQHSMANEGNVALALHSKDVPIMFYRGDVGHGIEWNRNEYTTKLLGRGTTYIPMNTVEGMEDASVFVELYEKYHEVKIADLKEIAAIRGLV